ncbi:MAG: hypothetical protein U0930_01020 [Pirellulales bacterium]
MNEEILQHVQQAYGVENWSAGYFEVNARGNITVRPAAGDPRYADLKEILDYLMARHKVQAPVLLRFPQILSAQLRKLSAAYQAAIAEYKYGGQHFPLYPMKVNPRREVVEEFLRESARCNALV